MNGDRWFPVFHEYAWERKEDGAKVSFEDTQRFARYARINGQAVEVPLGDDGLDQVWLAVHA